MSPIRSQSLPPVVPAEIVIEEPSPLQIGNNEIPSQEDNVLNISRALYIQYNTFLTFAHVANFFTFTMNGVTANSRILAAEKTAFTNTGVSVRREHPTWDEESKKEEIARLCKELHENTYKPQMDRLDTTINGLYFLMTMVWFAFLLNSVKHCYALRERRVTLSLEDKTTACINFVGGAALIACGSHLRTYQDDSFQYSAGLAMATGSLMVLEAQCRTPLCHRITNYFKGVARRLEAFFLQE